MIASPRRHGFSLVELLIVIGIVSALLALIIPAVQKVREAANRVQCVSNLRQLGMAAHQYHAARHKLPPGYLGPSLANNTAWPAHLHEGQWLGHLPLLLPYLDEQPLFKQLRINPAMHVVSTEAWFTSPGGGPHAENYAAAQHRLGLLRCPSAGEYYPEVGKKDGGGTPVGLHVFNSPERGAFTCGWKEGYYGPTARYPYLAKTNYVGVAGCGSGTNAALRQYEGIYTNRSDHSLGQIASLDGTSNTLLYGETCGSSWNSDPETVDISWMAAGGLGTYLGLQRGREATVIAFSSYQASGVHFCFADGSVHTLRFGNTATAPGKVPGADWSMLQELAGYRDGAASRNLLLD